jgi:hypothetical protein
VGEHDERQARAHRQGQVRVEGHAVEGPHLALAERDAVALIGARQAQRPGGVGGRRQRQRGEDEHRDPEASHTRWNA